MKARDLQAGAVFRVVLRDGSLSLAFEFVELIRGHGGPTSDLVRVLHRTKSIGGDEAHLSADWGVVIESEAAPADGEAVAGGVLAKNLP